MGASGLPSRAMLAKTGGSRTRPLVPVAPVAPISRLSFGVPSSYDSPHVGDGRGRVSKGAHYRCTCGSVLRPPSANAPAMRCPICAAVMQLADVPPAEQDAPAHLRATTGATPLPVDDPLLDEEPLDAIPLPYPDEGTAPRAIVLAEAVESPPARLLQAMPRRRHDPVFVWGSAAAFAVLAAAVGYLVGHAHGVSDAPRPDPALQAAVGATAPGHREAPRQSLWENDTERELFRLCRLLDETRPTFDDPLAETTAKGRRRLDKWAARWRKGFDGPLGMAARELGLTFDWHCIVAGFDIGKGFACRARKDGEIAFRINAFGLGRQFYDGKLELRSGDELVLSGARAALEEGTGSYLQMGTGCEMTLVTDKLDLVTVVPKGR